VIVLETKGDLKVADPMKYHHLVVGACNGQEWEWHGLFSYEFDLLFWIVLTFICYDLFIGLCHYGGICSEIVQTMTDFDAGLCEWTICGFAAQLVTWFKRC